MGHMHARKSRDKSTKPKIKKLTTIPTAETDELLEQQEPPRPDILLDRKERVGAHVVDIQPCLVKE